MPHVGAVGAITSTMRAKNGSSAHLKRGSHSASLTTSTSNFSGIFSTVKGKASAAAAAAGSAVRQAKGKLDAMLTSDTSATDPQPTPTVPRQHDLKLRQIEALGFSREAAQCALLKANGSVEEAAELLCDQVQRPQVREPERRPDLPTQVSPKVREGIVSTSWQQRERQEQASLPTRTAPGVAAEAAAVAAERRAQMQVGARTSMEDWRRLQRMQGMQGLGAASGSFAAKGKGFVKPSPQALADNSEAKAKGKGFVKPSPQALADNSEATDLELQWALQASMKREKVPMFTSTGASSSSGSSSSSSSSSNCGLERPIFTSTGGASSSSSSSNSGLQVPVFTSAAGASSSGSGHSSSSSSGINDTVQYKALAMRSAAVEEALARREEIAIQQALAESLMSSSCAAAVAAPAAAAPAVEDLPLPGTAAWKAARNAPPEEQLAALEIVSELFAQHSVKPAEEQMEREPASEPLPAAPWFLRPSTGTWLMALPAPKETCTEEELLAIEGQDEVQAKDDDISQPQHQGNKTAQDEEENLTRVRTHFDAQIACKKLTDSMAPAPTVLVRGGA